MTATGDRTPFIYVAGRVANLALAPLGAVILPGVLGEHGYGRYGYWFGLISVYLILFDLGTQPMLRRFMPELAVARPEAARRLFGTALALKLIPVPLFVAMLWFVDQPHVLVLLAAAALLAALATNLADVLYAYQHMGTHSLVVLGRKLARLVLVPTFFLLWDIAGILAALVTAELIGLILAYPARRPLSGATAPLPAPFFDYYRQGALVFAGMFLSISLGRLPVFSAQWSGLEAEVVGRVALCVDLTYFALKELINALSEAVLPRLVLHKTQHRVERLARLVALNYRLVNFTGLGIAALGVGLAGAFLPLLGEGFYRAESAFQLLLAVVLLGGWNLIHNHLLQLNNCAHAVAINQGIGLTTAVLGVMVFWPQLNPLALAACLVAGTGAATLSSYIQSRPLAPAGCAWPGFVRSLPGAMVVSGALLTWQPRGLVETALAAVIGLGAYLVTTLPLGALTPADLSLLRGALRGGRA